MNVKYNVTFYYLIVCILFTLKIFHPHRILETNRSDKKR